MGKINWGKPKSKINWGEPVDPLAAYEGINTSLAWFAQPEQFPTPVDEDVENLRGSLYPEPPPTAPGQERYAYMAEQKAKQPEIKNPFIIPRPDDWENTPTATKIAISAGEFPSAMTSLIFGMIPQTAGDIASRVGMGLKGETPEPTTTEPGGRYEQKYQMSLLHPDTKRHLGEWGTGYLPSFIDEPMIKALQEAGVVGGDFNIKTLKQNWKEDPFAVLLDMTIIGEGMLRLPTVAAKAGGASMKAAKIGAKLAEFDPGVKVRFNKMVKKGKLTPAEALAEIMDTADPALLKNIETLEVGKTAEALEKFGSQVREPFKYKIPTKEGIKEGTGAMKTALEVPRQYHQNVLHRAIQWGLEKGRAKSPVADKILGAVEGVFGANPVQRWIDAQFKWIPAKVRRSVESKYMKPLQKAFGKMTIEEIEDFVNALEGTHLDTAGRIQPGPYTIDVTPAYLEAYTLYQDLLGEIEAMSKKLGIEIGDDSARWSERARIDYDGPVPWDELTEDMVMIERRRAEARWKGDVPEVPPEVMPTEPPVKPKPVEPAMTSEELAAEMSREFIDEPVVAAEPPKADLKLVEPTTEFAPGDVVEVIGHEDLMGERVVVKDNLDGTIAVRDAKGEVFDWGRNTIKKKAAELLDEPVVAAKPPKELPQVPPEVKAVAGKQLWEIPVDDLFSIADDLSDYGETLMRNKHKKAVRSAIEEGKPIPPEVLADYPELAKSVKPLESMTVKELRAEGKRLGKKIPSKALKSEIIKYLRGEEGFLDLQIFSRSKPEQAAVAKVALKVEAPIYYRHLFPEKAKRGVMYSLLRGIDERGALPTKPGKPGFTKFRKGAEGYTRDAEYVSQYMVEELAQYKYDLEIFKEIDRYVVKDGRGQPWNVANYLKKGGDIPEGMEIYHPDAMIKQRARLGQANKVIHDALVNGEEPFGAIIQGIEAMFPTPEALWSLVNDGLNPKVYLIPEKIGTRFKQHLTYGKSPEKWATMFRSYNKLWKDGTLVGMFAGRWQTNNLIGNMLMSILDGSFLYLPKAVRLRLAREVGEAIPDMSFYERISTPTEAIPAEITGGGLYTQRARPYWKRVDEAPGKLTRAYNKVEGARKQFAQLGYDLNNIVDDLVKEAAYLKRMKPLIRAERAKAGYRSESGYMLDKIDKMSTTELADVLGDIQKMDPQLAERMSLDISRSVYDFSIRTPIDKWMSSYTHPFVSWWKFQHAYIMGMAVNSPAKAALLGRLFGISQDIKKMYWANEGRKWEDLSDYEQNAVPVGWDEEEGKPIMMFGQGSNIFYGIFDLANIVQGLGPAPKTAIEVAADMDLYKGRATNYPSDSVDPTRYSYMDYMEDQKTPWNLWQGESKGWMKAHHGMWHLFTNTVPYIGTVSQEIYKLFRPYAEYDAANPWSPPMPYMEGAEPKYPYEPDPWKKFARLFGINLGTMDTKAHRRRKSKFTPGQAREVWEKRDAE